jgi:segregation and condensation protein B
MLKGEVSNELLAILFAAQEPVTLAELQEVFPERSAEQLAGDIDGLAKQFNSTLTSIEIRRVAGGYRISTLPEFHEVVRSYLRTKPAAKLSLAALETLAVIAYKQPITLPEIMDIRGIKGTSTIKTLLQKKLIETRGRKKVVGRPILYGTTKDFLLHFGLDNLEELPTLEEFEEILTS